MENVSFVTTSQTLFAREYQCKMNDCPHVSLSFIQFNYSFLCNRMTFETLLSFSEHFERGNLVMWVWNSAWAYLMARIWAVKSTFFVNKYSYIFMKVTIIIIFISASLCFFKDTAVLNRHLKLDYKFESLLCKNIENHPWWFERLTKRSCDTSMYKWLVIFTCM